jgi:hypothetical protein
MNLGRIPLKSANQGLFAKPVSQVEAPCFAQVVKLLETLEAGESE